MLASEPTPFFVVKVSDPIKISGGAFSSHVEYKVSTRSNLPKFKEEEVTVTRRYSDFTWLSDILAAEFPGVVIPALPDKQISLGGFTKLSFSTDVDARARALEKFLQRVGAHPQLAYSKRFHVFLQCEDPGSFASAKVEPRDGEEAKSSGNAMAGVMGMLGNLAKQTTGQKAELERTSADERFDEISAYLTTLEGHLDKVSKAATAMVRRNRQSSEELFEFSQGVGGLGNCETDSLSMALTQTGSSLDQLSQAATKHVNGELLQLDEPLQEYVRLLRSLKAALKRRVDRKGAYALAVSDLESKHAALSKAAGAPSEEAKQVAVDKAQAHCDSCKEAYEKVTAELQDEFEVFKRQKTCDLKAILTQWVQLQIDYCQRAEETWTGLVPTLNSITIAGYDEGEGDDEGMGLGRANNDQDAYGAAAAGPPASAAARASDGRNATSYSGFDEVDPSKFTSYDHSANYGYSSSSPRSGRGSSKSNAGTGAGGGADADATPAMSDIDENPSPVVTQRSSVPSMVPPPPPPPPPVPTAASGEEAEEEEDCAGV